MAMAKTVVGSFNSYTQAQRVVDQLVDSGVARDDISIVANNANGTPAEGSDDSTAASATTGAVTGGAVGGAAGLTSCSATTPTTTRNKPKRNTQATKPDSTRMRSRSTTRTSIASVARCC